MLLGHVVVVQNGVIAKCIEQIDKGNEYIDKVDRELNKK